MLTIVELRKRAKREKLIVKATTASYVVAEQLASMVAKKLNQPLPSCFGVLYQKKTKCEQCLVKVYCEVVFEKALWRDSNLTSEPSEKDIDLSMPIGFREGSRSNTLIRKWNSMMTVDELKELSKSLFKSVIDVNRIIQQIKQRRLLVTEGNRYGIKTRLRRY